MSVDEDSAASRQLKAMLHRVAPSLIRQQLQQYLMSMRQGNTPSIFTILYCYLLVIVITTEFCQSMLLPSKSDSSTTGTPTSRSRSPAAPPTRQTSLPGSKVRVCMGHSTIIFIRVLFLVRFQSTSHHHQVSMYILHSQ